MDDELLNKATPFSKDAEDATIGSMMIDNDAIAIAYEKLSPEDFYQKTCGTFFKIMCELYKDNITVDPVTLQNKLKIENVPPEYSKTEYLVSLMNSVPTSANIAEYADIVKEKSILRKIIKISENISKMCYSEDVTKEEILEFAEGNFFDIENNKSKTEHKEIKDIVLSYIKKIEQVAKNKGKLGGLPTGFIDLDRKLNGLQNSDLILVAARPSMGKTAFALNILNHVVLKAKKTAAIFSLEMSAEQLVNRLISMHGVIESDHLRRGELSEEEWMKLTKVTKDIGLSGLVIDDQVDLTITSLRSKCRKIKIQHPDLSLIVIDYLQLMRGEKKNKSDNRQQEISDISRGLKQIARELEIPVVALSQLSRAPELRSEHRPIMSDLRESGAIEQDADVVMFIYRDEVYNKDTEKKNEAEIIVGKQRNGSIGTVNLTWIGKYTKFENHA